MASESSVRDSLSVEMIQQLQEGAMSGDANSAMKLSRYYGFVALDQNAELRWLQVAADNGMLEAQLDLALQLVATKSPNKEKEALSYLSLAARTNDATALYRYAQLLEQIESPPLSQQSARIAYYGAAMQGHFRAMKRLAVFESTGIGGPQDKVSGLAWLIRASRQVPANSVLYDETVKEIEVAKRNMSQTQLQQVEWLTASK